MGEEAKGVGGYLPSSSATHSPKSPLKKKIFQRYFNVKLIFLRLISDGLNGVDINSMT